MLIQFIEEKLLRRKRSSNVVETLLIDLSAVLVWRGTWGLMDEYLFPTHPNFSFLFSIFLGLGIVLFLRQSSKS